MPRRDTYAFRFECPLDLIIGIGFDKVRIYDQQDSLETQSLGIVGDLAAGTDLECIKSPFFSRKA